MCLDDAFHHVQPHAGTGSPHDHRVGESLEHPEDIPVAVFGDAYACIRKKHESPLLILPEPDVYPGGRRGVVHGVLHQVREDHLEGIGIDGNGYVVFLCVDTDGHVLEEDLVIGDVRGYELGGRYDREAVLVPAGAQAGDLQEIEDEGLLEVPVGCLVKKEQPLRPNEISIKNTAKVFFTPSTLLFLFINFLLC